MVLPLKICLGEEFTNWEVKHISQGQIKQQLSRKLEDSINQDLTDGKLGSLKMVDWSCQKPSKNQNRSQQVNMHHLCAFKYGCKAQVSGAVGFGHKSHILQHSPLGFELWSLPLHSSACAYASLKRCNSRYVFHRTRIFCNSSSSSFNLFVDASPPGKHVRVGWRPLLGQACLSYGNEDTLLLCDKPHWDPADHTHLYVTHRFFRHAITRKTLNKLSNYLGSQLLHSPSPSRTCYSDPLRTRIYGCIIFTAAFWFYYFWLKGLFVLIQLLLYI